MVYVVREMNNTVLRKRTIAVLIVTIAMMVAEIYYGIMTHSMGLTADGFHMGTHAVAFLITLIVCILVSRFQEQEHKLNALGGGVSAILLGVTALGVIYESVERFFKPLGISFEEAILVAIIGLGVNLLCMLIMGGNNPFHNHKCHHCGDEHHHHNHEENLDFKAAYLHIASDVLTSVLAIGALCAGKYFNLVFLDSVIGLVGGIIIAKWAFGILKSSYSELSKK